MKFILQKPNKLNNYIGVKYHIKINWPEDLIALHNFENGYCGISQIEGNKYCLCYLTTAKTLSGVVIPFLKWKNRSFAATIILKKFLKMLR